MSSPLASETSDLVERLALRIVILMSICLGLLFVIVRFFQSSTLCVMLCVMCVVRTDVVDQTEGKSTHAPERQVWATARKVEGTEPRTGLCSDSLWSWSRSVLCQRRNTSPSSPSSATATDQHPQQWLCTDVMSVCVCVCVCVEWPIHPSNIKFLYLFMAMTDQPEVAPWFEHVMKTENNTVPDCWNRQQRMQTSDEMQCTRHGEACAWKRLTRVQQ